MTLSNGLAGFIAIVVLLDDTVGTSYKAIYVTVVGLLEILRNIGVALDLYDAFSPKTESEKVVVAM